MIKISTKTICNRVEIEEILIDEGFDFSLEENVITIIEDSSCDEQEVKAYLEEVIEYWKHVKNLHNVNYKITIY